MFVFDESICELICNIYKRFFSWISYECSWHSKPLCNVPLYCTNELGILVWMNVKCELDIAYDWNPWYEYIQQPLPWPLCRPDATPRPTGDCPVDWPAPCSPAVVFPLADPVDVLASHVGRDNAAFHPLSRTHSLFPFVCLCISFFVRIFLVERGPPSFLDGAQCY